MGSITSWVRLEPRCRDDEMNEAVHARIYDPLWMLARQWQAAEFQGEDTGSPVLARWRADSAPITRYYAGAIKKDTSISAPRYDAKTMPLEALVERQPLRGPTGEGSLRLAVESRHALPAHARCAADLAQLSSGFPGALCAAAADRCGACKRSTRRRFRIGS